MRGKAGHGIAKFQMGDRVRFENDGPDGPEWRVVAYAYGKDTFDLMACNPRAPEQFRNKVEPDQLVLVEAAPSGER